MATTNPVQSPAKKPLPLQGLPITTLAVVGAVLLVILSFGYTTWPGPVLGLMGLLPFRHAEAVNNGKCTRVPGERILDSWKAARVVPPSSRIEIIWHEPSSMLYLACSTRFSRVGWAPTLDALDSATRSASDYVATYSPDTGAITRLEITNYPLPGSGISMHGMSIVPSSSDPNMLWVYLVNHRVPKTGGALNVGADSTIEVLRTRVGGQELEWIRTLRDDGKVIRTPNDVIGSPDGDWVYFTNEYSVKIGLSRVAARVGLPFGAGSVGFCHVEQGCKVVVPNVAGANGIARDRDGLIWVAESFAGRLRVFREKSVGELEDADAVYIHRYLDNIAIDPEGGIIVASFPRPVDFKHYYVAQGVGGHSPSSVHRVTLDPEYVGTTKDAKTSGNGEKYIVEKLFEDDGREASGITGAEYVPKRRRLFLHGTPTLSEFWTAPQLG